MALNEVRNTNDFYQGFQYLESVPFQDYLLCDYNRDGDSYRSPWSNTYEPPLEDGAMPSGTNFKNSVQLLSFAAVKTFCRVDDGLAGSARSKTPTILQF